MNIKATVLLFAAGLFCSLSTTIAVLHAQLPVVGKGEAALDQAAKDNKSAYILFHRDWDSSAQAAAQVTKAVADKYPEKATCININLTDPTEKTAVDRFKVSRAPTPLVLVVHPNGATTGAFVQKVEEAKLVECLISPKKAECMKLLQQNKLVLLCVQKAGQQSIPQGVHDFQADPQFASRAQILTMQTNDPNETGFGKELGIDVQNQASQTVFMAPPGVLVGKFAATASKDELVKALTAAGTCSNPNCKDPNCKHHHPQ